MEIPNIETVQVDCSNLSKEQIDKLVEIVEKNGYKIAPFPSAMLVDEDYKYFKFYDKNNVWFVDSNNKNATTITYDQFVEWYRKEEDFWFTNSSAGGEISIRYEEQN